MALSRLLYRSITPRLLSALQDTPVVVLHGARQTGKSTLARFVASGPHPAGYITLDDAGNLAAARRDPQGFVAGMSGPVVVDEIQRAPELLLAIKAEIDVNRRPGRFLLTGSAQLLQLPRLADTLVGRMEILTLWPFSQGEIAGVREGFIDALFSNSVPELPSSGSPAPSRRPSLWSRILSGGFPEALRRAGGERRRSWYESYLGTTLLRDVRDLANVAGLADLPRLLEATAGRVGGLLSYADLARDVGLNPMTLQRYFGLLEATFLVKTVRPWFTNRVKRVVKSPKLYLLDTGMLAHLLDVSAQQLRSAGKTAGQLLENFVAMELTKQASWSRTRPALLHFRGHDGREVDFILEAPGGRRLVGIEVKAGATLAASDFSGLRAFADAAGKRFHRGIVLYTGDATVPFSRNLHAVAVEALWTLASTPQT